MSCEHRLDAHRQEVCGLRWSPDGRQLASGGNDNRLLVWQDMNPTPLHTFRDHNAAVKAIAWSPHQVRRRDRHDSGCAARRLTSSCTRCDARYRAPLQSNLLASGGGTADRCIRFWNTLTGAALAAVDTGSQVCNIAWSKTSNELVSTHGYSQHQVRGSPQACMAARAYD